MLPLSLIVSDDNPGKGPGNPIFTHCLHLGDHGRICAGLRGFERTYYTVAVLVNCKADAAPLASVVWLGTWLGLGTLGHAILHVPHKKNHGTGRA